MRVLGPNEQNALRFSLASERQIPHEPHELHERNGAIAREALRGNAARS